MIAAIINPLWMFQDIDLLMTLGAIAINLHWILIQVRVSQAKSSAERTLAQF